MARFDDPEFGELDIPYGEYDIESETYNFNANVLPCGEVDKENNFYKSQVEHPSETVEQGNIESRKCYQSLLNQGWDIDEIIFLNGRKEFRFSKKVWFVFTLARWSY